jgi:hypothetical protein
LVELEEDRSSQSGADNGMRETVPVDPVMKWVGLEENPVVYVIKRIESA